MSYRLVALTPAVLVMSCAPVGRPITPTSMTVDTGCEPDATTVADMSRFSPDAAAIRCEPWDIGTGVTGYVWRAPNPKAALLLQHGYGHYAQQYVRESAQLIPHLLDMGVSVYAFDMWGNGRSPGKRGATDVRQTVADHLAARRKLAEQLEARSLPVFLLGHSVGGLVTATSVLCDQRDLRGVVLVSPMVADANPVVRTLTRLGASLIPARNVPGPPGKIELLTAVPEARAQLDRDSLYFRRVTWITAATGASIAHANWERYSQLRVPLLVVHGDADATDPGGRRRLIETVASMDKTFHLVPDGLHALLDDTRREAVRAFILDWIRARVPPLPRSIPRAE